MMPSDLARALEHAVGQRRAVLFSACEADPARLELQAQGEAPLGRFQDCERGIGDFRADAVAGQDEELLVHSSLMPALRIACVRLELGPHECVELLGGIAAGSALSC